MGAAALAGGEGAKAHHGRVRHVVETDAAPLRAARRIAGQPLAVGRDRRVAAARALRRVDAAARVVPLPPAERGLLQEVPGG